MPSPPTRKPRARTAGLKKETRLRDRIEVVLRDDRLLPRVLLVGLFLIVMVVVVKAWEPAFRFRLGDRVEHGMTARENFQVPNALQTEQRRQRALAQVPFVFRHDPSSLKNYPARFASHLRAVVQAQSLSDLPEDAEKAFGFAIPDDADDAQKKKITAEFQKFRRAIGADVGTVGEAIESIRNRFTEFLNELAAQGIVSVAELEQHGIDDQSVLKIIRPNETGDPPRVVRENVELAKLLQKDSDVVHSISGKLGLGDIRTQLSRWLLSELQPTLQFDQRATEGDRKARLKLVEPAYDNIIKGETVLAEPGTIITAKSLDLLLREHAALSASESLWQKLVRVVAVFVILGVVLALFGLFLAKQHSAVLASTRQLALLLGLITLTMLIAEPLSYDPYRAEVVPVLACVMIIAVAHNQTLAGVAGLAVVSVLSFSSTGTLTQFVVLSSVAATSLVGLSRINSRLTIIKTGFWAGVVYFLVSYSAAIIAAPRLIDALSNLSLIQLSALGALKCVIAGYLVAGSLPFVESAFGVVTNISLRELGDVSHPLLQELIRRAPGTYNHSVAVGTIGEAAADAIGANGLLVRVAAYFHDVGKMLKPQYFIENVGHGSESKHEHLAPAMSTLVIIGHVKDGVDLAHQYHLPQRVIDFVEQHHGTTLVEYFYRRATDEAEAESDGTTIEESSFRYPGPKPQTRETGVMMLADTVESASRALSEPTPKRIETLVERLTDKRLRDGQFEESGLTLTEVNIIKESLIKSLISIYHGRIKYQDQEETPQQAKSRKPVTNGASNGAAGEESETAIAAEPS